MENKVTYRGISLFSILGLIFITLKLMNIINWSWWWVLSPFWISGSISIVIISIVIVFFLKQLKDK